MPRNPKAKYEIRAEDKTKAAIASARGRLDSLKKSVFSVKGAISALAVSGLGLMIKKNLEAADAIGKAADAAGVGVESLQELRFAAERSGVSVSELDGGLRRFNRRLGLAAEGGGPAIAMFRDLGISISTTDGRIRNTEQVLDDVIARLAKMQSSARQAAAASAFFGDDAGPKLALLLQQGTDGIDQMRQKARELGLVLDEDLVRGAERANDRIEDLQKQFSVRTTRAIVEHTDEIIALADAVAFLIEKMSQGVGVVQDFGRNLAAILNPSDLDQTASRILEIQEEIEFLKRSIDDDSFAIRMERFFGNVPEKPEAVVRIRELSKELSLLMERFNRLKDIQDRIENRDTGRPEPGVPTEIPGDTLADEEAARELEKQQEKLAKKLEQLDTYLMTAEEREREALTNRAFLIEEAFENELITAERRNELLAKIDLKAKKAQLAREKQANDIILGMKKRNVSQIIGILRSFAGQNKGLAIAAIALEKAQAISETIINTEAAAVAAGKHAAAAGGAPAFAAAYSAVKAAGAVSVGLIAAQGLAEASQVGSGGASLGTPANPISVQDRSLEGFSLGGEDKQQEIVIKLGEEELGRVIVQQAEDGRIVLPSSAIQ